MSSRARMGPTVAARRDTLAGAGQFPSVRATGAPKRACVGREPEVAREGHEEAPAHRVALDHRDRGLRHRVDPPEDAADPRLVGEGVLLRLELEELADVRAADEGLVPCPAEHHRPHVRVGVEPLHVVVERLVHLERHRVPGLGPVDREERDAPLALQQELARHAAKAAAARGHPARVLLFPAALRPAIRRAGRRSRPVLPARGAATAWRSHPARARGSDAPPGCSPAGSSTRSCPSSSVHR